VLYVENCGEASLTPACLPDPPQPKRVLSGLIRAVSLTLSVSGQTQTSPNGVGSHADPSALVVEVALGTDGGLVGFCFW